MSLYDREHFRNVYPMDATRNWIGGPYPTREHAERGAVQKPAFRVRVIPYPAWKIAQIASKKRATEDYPADVLAQAKERLTRATPKAPVEIILIFALLAVIAVALVLTIFANAVCGGCL